MEELKITWYPSRPLLFSSGTSSVKRLFCGGLAGVTVGGAVLGGAAVDGGKGTGGRVCIDKKKLYCYFVQYVLQVISLVSKLVSCFRVCFPQENLFGNTVYYK